MILEYKQTAREPYHEFIVTDKNKNIYCKGICSSNAIMQNTIFDFKDNTRMVLHGDMQENLNEKPFEDSNKIFNSENDWMEANRGYILNEKEERLGEIKRHRVDTKVLWAEKYLINYQGSSYQGYYVAKPLKGLYYFVVDENKNTVFAIKQSLTAINYFFNYKIFLEDESYAKLAIMFLSYADNHMYGGRWVYSGIKIDSETTLVAQPEEVRNAYDLTFIQRVKNLNN